MAVVTLATLTEQKLDGKGVFDVLIQTVKLHLDKQYKDNRITGPEYATVYMNQINAAMQSALVFIGQNQRIGLEVELMEQQVLLAKEQVLQAKEQTLLVKAQVMLAELQAETAVFERELMQANVAKIEAEIVNIPKAGLQIEAQTSLINKNVEKATAELVLIPEQVLQLKAQVALANQQVANSIIEQGLIEANVAKIEAEVLNTPKQGVLLDAQAGLSVQQKANAIIEGTVLVAQECKLRAEFDLTEQGVLKGAAETTLLTQKVLTEKAQIQSLGVDDNSVIGRQKTLYLAQTDGFKRDAEQKLGKMYIDVWSAMRMTDPDGTPATAAYGLAPDQMAAVLTKARQGIGA